MKKQTYLHNLFDDKETSWIPILPGIRGRQGTRGLPSGFDIHENIGIDLIEMLPGTAFPTHTHPGAHLIFVVKGKGTVTIHKQTYLTRPGDCYFVPADVPHAVGAVEHHQILAIGFPHKPLSDPERMKIGDTSQ